jgi:undecaprenyl-phosphate 4-deoxy-4-formamido-L-arabinose transferase
MSCSLSVVVPVYKSEASLPELLRQLEQVLPTIAREYEVLLVNDGSPDGSWSVVADLMRRYPWVRGINLMRNYGQHNALLCGIRAANYDLLVTMDDDLQHPPEEISKLLAKLHEGYDVIYGKPRREEHSFWRWAASRATKIALQRVMGAYVAENVSAFRAFRTEIRNGFVHYHGPFVSIDVLLTWGANRFAAIDVEHCPRAVGKSNYTVGKLFRHALNMMTGFTVIPLQIASFTGFVFTAIGFLVFAFVIGRFFVQGGAVPGFPFLASIIAIFSGAQLFALGIIGEYLARIHFRVMDRPSYVVRHEETVTAQTPATPALGREIRG